MKLFALILFAITCIGLVGVGIRLLRAGARTRTLPEIIYGLAYLFGGASAFIRALVPILGLQPHHHWLQLSGGLIGAIATGCLLFGLRRIFRPDAKWALGIALAGVALLVVALVSKLGIPVDETETSVAQHVQASVGLTAYLWGAVESIRYHRLMRRRLALGLTNPVIVQQFQLWGMSFLAVSAAVSTHLCVTAVWNTGIAGFPPVLLVVQMLVASSAVCTWLCFFPPAAYRRWAETRWLPEMQ